MASLIQIDMPPGVKKAQESLDFFADFGIGSGLKNTADAVLSDAEQKTKAMVDMIIQTVENQIADMLENGIGNLYSAMGLNEETINMARSVIKLGNNATSLLSSGIMKGLMKLNNFNTLDLPMSALVAGLNIISSIADYFFKKYVEKYQAYIDLITEAIINPGAVVEILLDTLNQVIMRIYDMIDEQIFLYTGYRIAEIRYMCQQGYNYYKQWKELKKQQRRAGDVEVNKSISVTVSPDVMKENMMNWLRAQSDAIYNSFMVLQIMDAINSVKETVAALSNINLATLADDMNSLDDLIILLDQLGLGDDSTAVDLSMIPNLNINSIMSSMNSMMGNVTNLAQNAAITGIAAVNAGVNINASVSASRTYEIRSDHTTKTIYLSIYKNPTLESMSKDIYKILTETKNDKNKKLFNLSECKAIQTKINNMYNSNKESGKAHEVLTVAKFNIDITLDISADGKSVQKSFSYGNQNLGNQQKEVTLEDLQKQEDNILKQFNVQFNVVRGDDWESEEEMIQNRANSRRDTIALLHMCYSLLKSIFPILKNIAVLINNYKINKAYVAGKSRDNIFALFKEAMAKLGLNKQVNLNNRPTSDGKPAYLYTVRTYSFYRHLQDQNIVTTDTLTTFHITDNQVDSLNIWLAKYEPESQSIPTDKDNTLYIDYTSVNENRRCIEEQIATLAKTVPAELINSFVKKCNRYNNGTFDNLDNVEIDSGYILYSDKNLPRMPSQILMAKSKRLKPFN